MPIDSDFHNSFIQLVDIGFVCVVIFARYSLSSGLGATESMNTANEIFSCLLLIFVLNFAPNIAVTMEASDTNIVVGMLMLPMKSLREAFMLEEDDDYM